MLEDLSWVVRCVCCSTLVILATWLFALGSARRSAAIRHRIFWLGFAGLLIVPVAIAITAGWNPMISFSSPSNPDATVLSQTPADLSRESADPESTGSATAHVTPGMLEPAPQVVSVTPTNPSPPEPAVHESLVATSSAEQVSREIRSVPPSQDFVPKPQNVLGMVWAAGAMLLGIKLVLEWVLTRSLIRNGVPITDEPTATLLHETRSAIDRLAHRRQSRDQVLPQLLCSRATPVPIAAGILVPTIILPVGFGQWTSERLRVVLLHELTHLDRRDVLANVFARLACIIYWFNPLVWLAARRMCLERELACDDFLLCLGECAEDYANDLFEIAASVRKSLRTAQLATPMATQSHLKSRVQHLMKLDLDRRFVSPRTSSIAAVMAFATVMFLAVISPSCGIAQSGPTSKSGQTNQIGDRNASAVTLSGEFPADWFEQLNSMPKLRTLTIRNPKLHNFRIARLRELTNLTEFSVEDLSLETRLADSIAVNIAQLPRLKTVQFHRTGLTGRGLQALSRAPAAELILDGEELLTDADFKHVAGMPSLNRLVLDTTPIDVEGLQALQAASGLRRLAVLRHPAGSYQAGSQARVAAIAGFKNLEELELGDTGYSHLVPLRTARSLRLLTLRNSGANDASISLKQLTQLKRIQIDNCDIRNESFDTVKSKLAEIGIVFADVTRMSDNLLIGSSAPADEGTLLARKALEELDVGRQFPSFWIEWHHHWSKIPSMTAEPIRTVHRLKQALTAAHEKQPWQQDTTLAYAPGQFYMRNLALEGDVPRGEQTTYGDAKLAWSREGGPGNSAIHVLRKGVAEFEESLGYHLPGQLSITHQHLWWGTPTHHNFTSSPVSPQKVAYIELPAEDFADESCRVFLAPGRSERLWVSQATGRLRGSLHYIHQGYFTPFYKQDVVTKIAGRRIESQDEYSKLFSGPNAVSKELQNQLSEAWAEIEFSHAYPGTLVVLNDYREIAAGKWFPFQVTSSGWHHNPQNEGQYEFSVAESSVREVVLDRNDLESYWAEYLPKTGDKVQDQRYATAVDYLFDRDRTEDDVQALVNAQLLTFARSAIQIEKAQSPFAKMIGKPAPQLAGKDWIGERPDLTGKRYLLHFWATWCGPCKNDVPLLNSIAKDRIVIGVHPGDTALEQVSQSVKDSKMAYPTVVAARGSRDVMGYPAKMFPYCVEVDEQGNVAKHGFLNDVLGVKWRKNEVPNQTPQASGTVLAIDEKDGLAVISLGEADGVQSNQLLDVTREGKSIAQLRVVTLQKNRCVGGAVDTNEQATIKIGDKVLSFAATPGP
jgi:beta-lactamase regulating signal transducer with metallopeptidase domain/thiol-disulfide isomerase/thioredoxin